MGLLMAVSIGIGGDSHPSGTTTMTASTSECAYWRSEIRPPPSIKVLLKDGRTVWVDFKLYVARVTSSEWGSTPTELRRAGALASKQYAWRHVSRWSGQSWKGRCYHVVSWTADQIYKHGKVATVEANSARDWAFRYELRNRVTNNLVFTGYRAGARKRCASDAGFRLYARSATRCAWAGWSARRILEVYYSDRKAVLR